LLWRLSIELRDGQEVSETIEQRASKMAGGLLLALAAYVIAAAVWGL